MTNDTPTNQPGAVTRLLREASRGDRAAFERLVPLVYDELKRIAHGRLRLERPGHTLNTTALVHEAYLKLIDQTRVEWQSRVHFYAVASQAMRRILIDYAKQRAAAKRGARAEHVQLLPDDGAPGLEALVTDERVTELLTLDEALTRLAVFNPRGAEVVEYRFFGGLSHGEIAEVTGVSEITVRRSWSMAKTWLKRELA